MTRTRRLRALVSSRPGAGRKRQGSRSELESVRTKFWQSTGRLAESTYTFETTIQLGTDQHIFRHSHDKVFFINQKPKGLLTRPDRKKKNRPESSILFLMLCLYIYRKPDRQKKFGPPVFYLNIIITIQARPMPGLKKRR